MHEIRNRKKICVVFRGFLREWKYAKESIFTTLKPFEDVHDVYYLMVVWKDGEYSFNNLSRDFIGKNVLGIRFVDPKKTKEEIVGDFLFSLNFEMSSCIRYLANQYKIEHERFGRFDEVIELRPDIFLVPQTSQEFISIALNENIPTNTLYVPGGMSLRQVQVRANYFETLPFTDDNIIVSSSEANDVLNSQFLFFRDHKSNKTFSRLNPHFLMGIHCARAGLRIENRIHYYLERYAIIRNPKKFKIDINFSEINATTAELIEQENQRFLKAKNKGTF